MSTGPISPVAYAFPHIQWDALGALRLTAQETALLRYVESNPIDYAVAEARDASNYARVLLKLLAEACAAGAGTGKSKICRNFGMKKYVIEISFVFLSSHHPFCYQAKFQPLQKNATKKRQCKP